MKNDNFIVIEDNSIWNETSLETLLRKSINFNKFYNFKLQTDHEIIKKWRSAYFGK